MAFQVDAFQNDAFQNDGGTFTGGRGQAQCDVKQTYFSHGQAQCDVKQTYFSHGQAQCDIKHTYFGHGQAQCYVFNNKVFGQAQAEIDAECSDGVFQEDAFQNDAFQVCGEETFTGGLGQAQCDVKQTYYGHGQAQCDVKAVNYGHGQAQCDVKTQGYGHGQAQCLLLNRYNGHGQAQCDVKATTSACGQAQCYVPLTRFAWLIDSFTRFTFPGDLGQPDIVGPPYALDDNFEIPPDVQADGSKLTFTLDDNFASNTNILEMFSDLGAEDITAYYEFKYDLYDPDGFYEIYLRTDGEYNIYVFASLFDIGLTIGWFDGIDSWTEDGPPFTLVDGETYAVRFDAVDQVIRAKIWNINDPEPDWMVSTTTSAAMDVGGGALISHSQGTYPLVNGEIDNYNIYQLDLLDTTYRAGQAQADIKAVGYGSGQAQALITKGYGTGQAQADILRTVNRSGQAQCLVNKSNGSGQAQCDVKRVTNRSGQAQCFILKAKGHGQAQCDVKRAQNRSGQAQCFISKSAGYGQARVRINKVKTGIGQARVVIRLIVATGQAQAQIAGSTYAHGQAQAIINQALQAGQAQATILAKCYSSGQAQVKIQKYPFQFAQAQASIHAITAGYGQAQCQINKKLGHGQAQCYVLNGHAHGQAQCVIIIRGFNYGQAQCFINRRQGYGQAQCVIKHSSSGQAMASIAAHRYATGYAMALIFNAAAVTRTACGQAQAYILKTVKCGQAEALIKRFGTNGHGQAQCQIVTSKQSGQAQAFIGDGRYYVSFNGKQLPGYAQSETMEDVAEIQNHFVTYKGSTLDEYYGLRNKIINLKFKVIAGDLADGKAQINKAATILRSKRKGFAKLYIQNFHKYYLAITQSITTEHEARTNKVVDYAVNFEAKPWLIGEQTYTVSGTGIVDTSNRTLYNGGWTPARIRVTGSNITISGYTDTQFTGFISISGAVTNMVINSEAYTATIGGVNKNNLMSNLDYALYVGPGVTHFDINGATDCVIEWEDRWYL